MEYEVVDIKAFPTTANRTLLLELDTNRVSVEYNFFFLFVQVQL